MFRRFNLLNLILACMITLLGANTYRVLSKPTIDSKDSERFSPQTDKLINKRVDGIKTEKTFPSFYNTVVEKNIFRPQRVEWIPPPPPPPPSPSPEPIKKKVETEIVLPDLTLKGVVLLDDGRRIAIVEGSFTRYEKVEVVKQQVSGSPTTTIKQIEKKKDLKDHRLYVGDTIETFTVSDILPDHLILVNSREEEFIFMLGEGQGEAKNEESTDKGERKSEEENGTYVEADTMIITIKSSKPSSQSSGGESKPSTASVAGGASKSSPIKGGSKGNTAGGGNSMKTSTSAKSGQHVSGNAPKHVSGN